MERSKQNKHVVCDKDNDVDSGGNDSADNGDIDCVDDGDDANIDNGDDGADKLLAHLSQAADCCWMERSKQNEHVVCDNDNHVDDGFDNGDDDSADDNDDDGVDN
eukprot:8328317-Ditylum_brightwellii.AAC.1